MGSARTMRDGGGSLGERPCRILLSLYPILPFCQSTRIYSIYYGHIQRSDSVGFGRIDPAEEGGAGDHPDRLKEPEFGCVLAGIRSPKRGADGVSIESASNLYHNVKFVLRQGEFFREAETFFAHDQAERGAECPTIHWIPHPGQGRSSWDLPPSASRRATPGNPALCPGGRRFRGFYHSICV